MVQRPWIIDGPRDAWRMEQPPGGGTSAQCEALGIARVDSAMPDSPGVVGATSLTASWEWEIEDQFLITIGNNKRFPVPTQRSTVSEQRLVIGMPAGCSAPFFTPLSMSLGPYELGWTPVFQNLAFPWPVDFRKMLVNFSVSFHVHVTDKAFNEVTYNELEAMGGTLVGRNNWPYGRTECAPIEYRRNALGNLEQVAPEASVSAAKFNMLDGADLFGLNVQSDFAAALVPDPFLVEMRLDASHVVFFSTVSGMNEVYWKSVTLSANFEDRLPFGAGPGVVLLFPSAADQQTSF